MPESGTSADEKDPAKQKFGTIDSRSSAGVFLWFVDRLLPFWHV